MNQAAHKLVSPSVVNAIIRAWRLARIATDCGALSWPSTNILHPTHGVGEASGLPPAQGMTDAEMVQDIVERMPAEMRSAFEAFHIGVIRGDSIRDWGHKARWLVLGISRPTYYRRVNAGWRFVQDWLSEALTS